MTEQDAQEWVRTRWGSVAMEQLRRFAGLLVAENQRQNLVSAGSLPHLWVRHVVDSAQLVTLASQNTGSWLDVGTGGGFPGMIAAILRPGKTILVEPRRRRAEFLASVVAQLGLGGVTVFADRVERVAAAASIISARAVATPNRFFALTRSVASRDTLYLLPSGRDAEVALAEAKRDWRGVFHVEQSITDPTSGVIVAHDVQAR